MALPNLPIYNLGYEQAATIAESAPFLIKVTSTKGDGSAIYATTFPSVSDFQNWTNDSDTGIRVLDANGVELANTGYFDMPSAGDYYIHVTNFSANSVFVTGDHATFGDAGSLTNVGVITVAVPATPATPRTNMKFSQKSIKGLPEALSALAAQIAAQGTAGSTALTAAINAEIAARTAADTAISNVLDVVNGDSTVEGSFRKAIADVIGSAPEAFDTLKEIADYIAVNPSANVADAINAAIAAANQAVTDLTAAVDAEKAYSDFAFRRNTRVNTHNFSLSGATMTDSKVEIPDISDGQWGNMYFVLNFGYARVTNIVLGETYDLPVTAGEGGILLIDFSGYEAEATDLSQFVGTVQYAYSPNPEQERLNYSM